MIVTSRPAFRSASVSSEATFASYESMTSDTSGSESGKNGNYKSSPLSPATPPPTEQHLISHGKGFVQPSFMEIDGEGDNDAATVRSPSMRTYREGDDKRFTGLTALSSSEKAKEEARPQDTGLVPGPMRVTLRDDGAVEGERTAEESAGIQIQINGQKEIDQLGGLETGGSENARSARSASRYVEMLDAEVTPGQMATWLYGSPEWQRPAPSKSVPVAANTSKTRQSSSPTSMFSRPFLKIATAWSATGSVKSPTSGPSSATSAASTRQIALGQQLPLGTSMKTSRSKSSNAASNSTSPTGSSNGWRRSFLGGRTPAKIQQRPKSMQIVSDFRIEEDKSKSYDNEEKRWIPATRESPRRFSMSGESDDNNLSDVAPSFASSIESGNGFAKSRRLRRPSAMLRRISSAQRSFTSAGSSVFLPTPREEKEESAFDFTSELAPSSSTATHLRTSSASKDGASNRRFIKMLRRISGHGWKEEDQLRRVTSPESQISYRRPGSGLHGPASMVRSEGSQDMARFPASFSSFGSGTEDTGCPPPLSSNINNMGNSEYPYPVMPASKPHLQSRSFTDVRNLKSVDEEELPLPCSPAERNFAEVTDGDQPVI